jgi:WhiB family redox-sensing transcriptional regulator
MTEYATNWRVTGACRSADPDLFFPIAEVPATERQVRLAQRICAGCAVRQQCLDFAMRTGEAYGIWGGTTPAERIRVRRARTERRRRARRSWPVNTPEIRASLSASIEGPASKPIAHSTHSSHSSRANCAIGRPFPGAGSRCHGLGW